MRLLLLVVLVSGCFFEPDRPGNGSNQTPPAGIATLSASYNYACSIRPDHTLMCWGDNGHRQLGTDTVTSPAPRAIPGSSWQAIATTGGFACGIADSILTCWGYINGSFQDPQAEMLPGGVTAERLFGGDDIVCATAQGDIYCKGQLDDDQQHQLTDWTKLDIGGTQGPWASLALGYSHSCAIDQAGHAYCWGQDGGFELGIDNAGQPVAYGNAKPIPGYVFSRLTMADSGACGITTDAKLVCWGIGVVGGDGHLKSMDTHTWTAITATSSAECGIRDGKVWCFGDNSDGAMGDGFESHRDFKSSVYDAATEVSGGGDFVCATNGTDVSCWGSNRFGEMGNGKVAITTTPTKIKLPDGQAYTSPVAGVEHSCVLSNGTPYCWGSNLAAQSDAAASEASFDVPHPVAETMIKLAAAPDHTCGLTANGAKMDCWGAPDPIGAASGNTSSTTHPGSDAWTMVGIGDAASCAGTAQQEIQCKGNPPWGSGTNPLSGPFVAPGTSVIAASSGSTDIHLSGHICNNPDGNPQITLTANVVQLVASSYRAQLGAASAHICALDASNDIHCFGWNTSHEVSPLDMDCIDPNAAVPLISDIHGQWTTVAANGRHTCAIAQGDIYCWGQNEGGEMLVPDVTLNDPTKLDTGTLTWQSIALGVHHMCGLATDSQVYCWGLDIYGETGGPERFHDTPTPVQF